MAMIDDANDVKQDSHATNTKQVKEFKRRMLAWPNPVEFVNNMYGSHPDDDGTEYFKRVFEK